MNNNEKSDGILKANRNSSIELLRIITMMGVVILHYNNASMGGGFKYVEEGSINRIFLYITENMFICAVNLFVLISAYFLAVSRQRKLIKIVELIIQVMAFRIAFHIAGLVMGNEFSVKSFLVSLLPANYFVILYSVVYILSPYINVLIDRLTKEQFKKLVIVLFTLFSCWTFFVDIIEALNGDSILGLSTVGMYGNQYGYTIVNFLLIYFIGAYIRKNSVSISKSKALTGMVVCFAILFASSLAEHMLGFENTISWNYNNPFVIIMAVFVLLFFNAFNFVSKPVNELAKGSFTCFLFHVGLLNYVLIEKFCTGNIIMLILHQLSVAVALYIVSYVVYKIYYLCSHWFIKLITPLVSKMDINI